MPHRIFKRKSSGINAQNKTLTSLSKPSIEESSCITHSYNGIQSASPNISNTIPNRVFVGGLAASIDEWDIRMKFAKFGQVRFVKIIRDNMGASRGYGFVTFNTEEEAKNAIEKAHVVINGRTLNVATAMKKKASQSDSASTEISSSESMFGESIGKQPNYDFKKPMACYNDISSTYPYENCEHSDTTIMINTPDNMNNQFNCMMPYPYVVYVPQYPYQFSGAGVQYSPECSFSDLFPVIPVPVQTCCLNGEWGSHVEVT